MDKETMKDYISKGITSLSAMEILENAKKMKPFRCSKCNRLLAKVHKNSTTIPANIVPHTGNITAIDDDHTKMEIKCPKCSEINEIIV